MQKADASSQPAPIIVAATFGAAHFRLLDALRRAHYPPERNQIAAHLTLFHHLPPSLSGEVDTRLRAATRRVERPSATIDGAMSLGNGTALKVRSEALSAIRAELADAFAGCLTPQDSAGWRPHVTIQNKVSAQDAKTLMTMIGESFASRPLVIAGLAAYHYRGGPWELIVEHRFSG